MFEGIATGFSQLPLAPEPVNPDQSPDYLAGLRDFAGQFLTGCIVLVAISAIVSVTLFVIGKMTALSNAQAKSLMWSGRVFLGAAIIGSVGGLIFWGSGLGKFNLMPSGAQQPTVEVTKKPAKATCTNEVDAPNDRNLSFAISDEDRKELAHALLSENDAKEVEKWSVLFFAYVPQGPDCTSANRTPDPCKKVKVTDNLLNPVTTEFDPRNKSECKN
jgi:hypothetical protein